MRAQNRNVMWWMVGGRVVEWGFCSSFCWSDSWDCLSMVLRWTTHTKPNERQMYCYCDNLQSGVWQRGVEESIETGDKGSRQQAFENIYTVTSFVTDTPHHMLVGRLTVWSTKLVYAMCNKLGNVWQGVTVLVFSLCYCSDIFDLWIKTFHVIFLATRKWQFETMSTNNCILNMFCYCLHKNCLARYHANFK